MSFSEKEILEEMDLAFNNKPGRYFPPAKEGDVLLNFFPDLEHGYCLTAGNRFHLYADSEHWAVVFEKSGYQNRRTTAEIELNYYGNCINWPVEPGPDGNYITNSYGVMLIDSDEFGRIENREGDEMETFEMISPDTDKIRVRDTHINFDSNYSNYEKLGIQFNEDYNPRKLIGFGDLIRYLSETDPQLIAATEAEIRKVFSTEIPKLMTIDDFHFTSVFDRTIPPSRQETYRLMAKVLTTGDYKEWKPVLPPNNSWRNWESGNL
ncbi:MAG: hypothetical protein J5I50_08765 [Chitinophagaceae bacterium]|nr:hypothetical protein [Chitinophagaceae bacterium]